MKNINGEFTLAIAPSFWHVRKLVRRLPQVRAKFDPRNLAYHPFGRPGQDESRRGKAGRHSSHQQRRQSIKACHASSERRMTSLSLPWPNQSYSQHTGTESVVEYLATRCTNDPDSCRWSFSWHRRSWRSKGYRRRSKRFVGPTMMQACAWWK